MATYKIEIQNESEDSIRTEWIYIEDTKSTMEEIYDKAYDMLSDGEEILDIQLEH